MHEPTLCRRGPLGARLLPALILTLALAIVATTWLTPDPAGRTADAGNPFVCAATRACCCRTGAWAHRHHTERAPGGAGRRAAGGARELRRNRRTARHARHAGRRARAAGRDRRGQGRGPRSAAALRRPDGTLSECRGAWPRDAGLQAGCPGGSRPRASTRRARARRALTRRALTRSGALHRAEAGSRGGARAP